jgi:acid phosphatase class B
MNWLLTAQKEQKATIISFDFDDTTVFQPSEENEIDFEVVGELNPEAAELMDLYHKNGCVVVIVTCRCSNELKAVWEAIKQYGLPVGNVYATNRQDKSIVLSEIGASVHYDDSEFRLQQIHEALGNRIKLYRVNEMYKTIESFN